GGNFHFVVVDPGDVRIEADRVGIADEVDLVAARSQFQAQFRGDDSAAAVCGIAGDADLHFCSVALRPRAGRGRPWNLTRMYLKINLLCGLSCGRLAPRFCLWNTRYTNISPLITGVRA